MLAAIVPTESSLIFFKLTGPDEAVAEEFDRFVALLKSVRFDGDKPTWTLPQYWKQETGEGMRLATIQVPTQGPPLEMTVIPLGRGDGPLDDQILANVNRWRGQLQLSPVTQSTLQAESPEWTWLKVADKSVIVVNFVGKLSSSGQPPFAPFAGGSRPTPRPTQPEGPAPRGPEVAGAFDYETPSGWRAGRAGGMRKAAFEVGQGDQKAEITVIALVAGQSVLANVNRWRGQVGLENIDQAQLQQQMQELPVDGQASPFVQIYGPQESILAVLVEHGGQTWFIRLKGPTELARREKDNFEKFVRSMRWK